MYNIDEKNKLYLGLLVVLTALTITLNCCKEIYQCSLVFALIGLTVNTITTKLNKRYALNGLILAATLSFIISYKFPYYIEGKLINLLALGSLAALVVSMGIMTILFVHLKKQADFTLASFVTISIASVIDCVVMSYFFITENSLSLNKILNIGIKEMTWKVVYAAIFSTLIGIVMYFVNNQRQRVIVRDGYQRNR